MEADAGLLALDSVFELMQIDREWSTRSSRTFTWWAGELAQVVTAREVERSFDHDVSRVDIRTDLSQSRNSTEKTAELAVILNANSMSTSCVVQNEDDPSLMQLAASLTVHNGVLPWRKQLIAFVAATQACEAHSLAGGLEGQIGLPAARSSHPVSGPRTTPDDMLNTISMLVLPKGARPNLFVGEQMKATLGYAVVPPCVLVNGDETGIAAEYPFGEATTLVQLTTSGGEPHPLGNGLRVVSRYPVGPSQGVSPLSCMDIQLRELHRGADGLLCLGAWTQDADGYLYHSLFVPNAIRSSVEIADFFLAEIHRARWVTEEVYNLPWEVYFRRAFARKAEAIEAFEEHVNGGGAIPSPYLTPPGPPRSE